MSRFLSRRQPGFRAALLVLLFAPLAAWPGPGAGDPRSLVTGVVEDLVATVSECRFVLATDPAALRALADRQIRPFLDVLFAGQVILGRWWPQASPAERRAFAEALFGSLANRYGPSLLLVTRETLSLPGSDITAPDQGEAVVPMIVSVPGYPPVPVDLHLRRTQDRWRVFDARVEDLSSILQLRARFDEEISRDGLPAVIARLQSAAEIPRPPGAAARRCLGQEPGE